ncbi:receptor-type tyrosine-protein phosphatase S [Paragonimus westermani]|uniref:Receptor-type tyrosine-protein phosphatase S n=1 Tax=Paragonimus westermani TaxID=34504 RepID=A0A5J4NYD6_9TREM|nr:receptor-type tyrosine-protein phosphatase S [Paragonimus westermani]
MLLPNDLKNVTKTAGDRVKLIDANKVITLADSINQFQAIVTSITQLKPFTDYTVWARAVGSDNDASLPGLPFSFVTQEIAPSSPPRQVSAQAISNAAVTVYWNPPLEANGRIRAYRVYHTDRPNLELAYWDTSIVDLDANQQTQLSTGNESTTPESGATGSSRPGLLYILSHLTANATYFVRVSAVNGKGEGPASDATVVIVRPGLPGEPTNLTVEALSSNELKVQWQPPVMNHPIAQTDSKSTRIAYYDLSWRPSTSTGTWIRTDHVSSAWGTSQATATTSQLTDPQGFSRRLIPAHSDTSTTSWYSAVISGLQPATYYVVHLRAVAPSGSGDRAVATPVQTWESPPTGSPFNLTVIENNDTPLTLSWSAPDWIHRHGAFLAYELQCEAANGGGTQESLPIINVSLDNSLVEWPGQVRINPHSLIAWPNGRLALMSALQINRLGQDMYCMVRARTKYGTGPWSAPQRILTKQPEAVPPPPKEIRAILMPSGDLRVSWTMPPGLIQTRWVVDGPMNNQTSSRPIVYRRFAVYVSPQLHKNWTRYLTKGPTTELVVPKRYVSPLVGHMVRVSSIGGIAGGHEGTWSDAVVMQRISARSEAVQVSNLTCDLSVLYSYPRRSWSVELGWSTPTRLRVGRSLDRLLHYRVNYTVANQLSSNPSASREYSVRANDAPASSFIRHKLNGIPSNAVYVISVRPVLSRSSANAMSSSDLLADLYGVPSEVKCVTPKEVELRVEPPWVIKLDSVKSAKENTRMLIGCEVSHDGGSGESSTASKSVPSVHFELFGHRLDHNSDEPLVLARWVSSQPMRKNQRFQVELGEVALNSPSSTALPTTTDDRIKGLRLELGHSYTLALRACVRALASTYATEAARFRPQNTCYQSLWSQPVGPNLPVPKAAQSRVVTVPDPDRTLWPSETESDMASLLNRPPSDDATAHGPGWSSNLHGKRQSDASIVSDVHKSGPSQRETIDFPLTHTVVGEDKRPVHSATVSVLVVVVSVTVLLVGIGLCCLLLVVHRRRKRSDIDGRVVPARAKSWTTDRTGRWQAGLPAYSLLSWIGSKKRGSRRRLSHSFNLIDNRGPPPGSGSITANLPVSLPPYSTSSCYEDSVARFGAGEMMHRMGPNGTNASYNSSMDPLGCHSQFGSLRTDNVRHELTHIGTPESPNGTLYTGGLHRVNSTCLGYQPLASPSSTSVYATQVPDPSGFTVGSLKSVHTMGSKSTSTQGNFTTLGMNCANPMLSNLGSRLPETGLSRLIGMNQLVDRVQTLKADSGRLMAAEFESIDPGGQFTWEHSNRPANRPKNRYANVIAYDHSRVVLQYTSPNDPDSDYINANYLDGYRKQNAYIATQGPLPHTVNDFWRMVWEQRSAMIVSMTRLEERARVKCEQYWPGNGSSTVVVGTSGGSGGVLGSAVSGAVSPEQHRFMPSKVQESKLWLKDNSASALPPTISFRTNGFGLSDYSTDESTVFVNTQSLPEENGWDVTCSDMLGEAVYGDITVGLLDVMELAYYTIRTFVLHKTGSAERREVRQLQFTAWPDHGVPNHPAPLLMFLRRVRAECPPDVGPIIVHCSAGVGRTGAFILLDILLEQMRREKAVDVFTTVSRLRAQRNFMVQTEDQYAFVYEALVEAAASGNTELTVRQLAAHWARLTRSDDKLAGRGDEPSKSASTGLELEFSQLVSQNQLTKVISSAPSSIGLLSPIDPFSSQDEDHSNASAGIPRLPPITSNTIGKSNAATLRVNLAKNRNMEFVPHEANRVALTAIRGVDGSDYINASYIDGYRSRAAYIATQAPLSTTLDDFWRAIWETGSCLIVRMENTPSYDDPQSADMPFYWPTAQSTRHGFLVVDPIATYTMTSYVMREMRLTDTRDGATRTVRQFDVSPTADAMGALEAPTAYLPDQHKASRRANTDFYDTSNEVKSPTSPLLHGDSALETSSTNYSGIGRFDQRRLSVNFRQRCHQLSEAMLEIVIQVHKTKEHFGMEGPITVHCNLGAGRTGVFLTIALILERMRYEGVVDMFQTVKLLRWQRPGLIRTATEYAFCYATALEYLESFERYVG